MTSAPLQRAREVSAGTLLGPLVPCSGAFAGPHARPFAPTDTAYATPPFARGSASPFAVIWLLSAIRSGECGQRRPGEPVHRPVAEGLGTEPAVELEGWGVPVEDVPLQPLVPSLDGDRSEPGEQGPA